MMRLRSMGLPVLLLVAAACSKQAAAPPVATVSLTPSKEKVAQGGIVDLTYRFQVAPDAKITSDYRVFVHLNRDDGTTIWFDDHELSDSLRTSRWQPGQVIEYTRTRFIPTFSYLGPATIEMGLYRDDERLPLAVAGQPDNPERAYKVASIELRPRSENVQVYKLTGWHGAEYASDDPTMEWQWTQKVATFGVRNQQKDVTLFIDYDTRADVFGGQPQQVSVFAGDVRIATFSAAPSQTLERIPVTAAQMGSAEMTEFRIEVDRTFVPAKLPNVGNDHRELGLRIFHVHVEPR